ncbi:hypothetical protein Mgra_00003548 [Meloidogyne graminicola]|uniref:Uncharacterized protein n=2 Tax=Meloidogyne graminicola TaxID=189291 RepID=A0A8S9ZTR7_9BILA|nr:hypothetical protein Mgra_00003548 [Meloidogyne graminicola]
MYYFLDDGSMVVIKRNWGDFQKDFNYPLEVVAKAMGFADLEYIGNGKLKFLNDGLGKKKGYIETTWNVYELISKVENSGWSVEYNNNAIVNSILGGHVYVILSHKGHQIVKFHFHQHGLNIFRKEKNQHFLIKNNEQLEEEPVKDPLDFYRIEYSEGEFSRKIGQVKTYLFTINELKQIAIKRVINIRKYGPGFYCYNFAYDFVHAVAKNQNNVMHLKFWPENYLEFLVYMKKSDFTFSFRAFIDPE